MDSLKVSQFLDLKLVNRQFCFQHKIKNLVFCKQLVKLDQVPSGARIPPASAISWYIKKPTKSMKYRSLWPTFSLRSNSGHSHSFIPNFHVALNIQDKITGSWNICQRYTSIIRLKVGLYWLIIPSYHFHTSNRLQDIWQNHCTMKQRSQWSTDAWKDRLTDWKTKTKYPSTYFV